MCIILQAMLNHYYGFLIIFQYFVQNQHLDMFVHRWILNQFVEDHSKIIIKENNLYYVYEIQTSLYLIHILISSNDFPNLIESSSASDRTV